VIEIKMPRLSDTMEEGAISTWRKQPGDKVAVGDVLVEIETDKAVMEYEAYQAGTLAEILIPEGRNADIGAPIALLDDGAGSPAPAAPAAPPKTAAAERSGPTLVPNTDPATPATTLVGSASPQPGASAGGDANGYANGSSRQIASPLVRKLVRENHLDLSQVTGSGPGGRIIRADIASLLGAPAAAPGSSPAGVVAPGSSPAAVSGAAADPQTEAGPTAPVPAASAVSGPAVSGPAVSGPAVSGPAVAAPVPTASAVPVTPPADEVRGSRELPVSQVRRVIARRLTASARDIPHFYVTAVADAQALMDLRSTLNAQLTEAGRAKISVNDLLIRACALALREHPDVNVSYGGDDSSVTLIHDRINIGVAVAAESGLIVPVITDADAKTVTQLGAEARKLVALAAERKLTPSQTSGGTFTISNLGMFGVEHFTAIINPPESAILAVGATTREPTVVGDAVEPRYRLRYTLSVDHRVIDGALAARFLHTLTGLVEHPWMIIA
jgi:pyruvate dehydrogenase E2 component (dihydrolipoamide acetyltransferase)